MDPRAEPCLYRRGRERREVGVPLLRGRARGWCAAGVTGPPTVAYNLDRPGADLRDARAR